MTSTAESAFEEHRATIEGLLKTIQTKIGNDKPETPNWGDVGSMEYIAKQLVEINRFLG